MSGLITGLVWELQCNDQFKPDDKYVALAYADHAWQDGTHAFPSIETIANKTGKSERAVQRHIRNLEALGLLILAGKGKHGTNSYNFPLQKKPDGTPYLDIKKGCQNDTLTKRAGVSPVTPEGMTPEEMTPEPKVLIKDLNDNDKKPAPNIFTIYEQTIGLITSNLVDDLREAENTYPAEWIAKAFKVAAENNARNWTYVKAVLRNMQTHGVDWKPTKPARENKPNGQTRANNPKPAQEPAVYTDEQRAAAAKIRAAREAERAAYAKERDARINSNLPTV